MARVRIYQPFKNPMQSGRRKTKKWILAFEKIAPESPSLPMGWLSSQDMRQELKLTFPSLLQAIEYAKRHNLTHTVCNAYSPEPLPKAYQNNFTCSRIRNESSSCHFLLREGNESPTNLI